MGASSRATCGACHFNGGGGDGVKHGDLDSSLLTPDRQLDVHMDADGLNFACTRCHTATSHKIEGLFYSVPVTTKYKSAMPSDSKSRIACESCHSSRPHKTNSKLNDHTARIACETCHVPLLAKKLPTLVRWDWSTAGKFKEGHKFIVKKDSLGKVSYHTKKGSLTWAKNVVPEYSWFNGIITHVLATDTIDETRPVRMTILHGDKNDPKSRITPFKMMRGKQVYDAGRKKLVVPKLFGPKGSGAYWKDYDWVKSAAAGQHVIGQPFSGEIGFIETEYLRPVAHMIPPANEALSCESCHSRDGRLKKLTGFYMPGRDFSAGLDRTGWLSCLSLLILVGLHGALRIIISKGRRNS